MNKTRILQAGLLLMAGLTTACSQTPSFTTSQPATDAAGVPRQLPPVEARSPNTNYQSAFPGQTRVPGMRTDFPFQVSILTERLESPWSVNSLPDGRLIVTQKAGSIAIVDSSGTVSPPITGFPPIESSGQGGLLDLALDPDFSSNRYLFFTFSEQLEQGSVTAVGRARLADDERSVEEAVVLYRAMPANGRAAHYGSRLSFDKSGNLLITTGERQSASTRVKAQSLDNGYGKVLRISRDGQALADNPFVGRSDAMPEIYSYGHRNVQGLALHPETGDIWISEMGPRGGDELNRILPGKNYGWPVISYGIEYSGFKIGEGLTQKAGMEQPVYYWDPVLAPSGMTFYTSDSIPEWRGNLFIAGLAGQHIARIVLKSDRVVGEERLLDDENQRFRDVTQGADGAIYAVTDSGRLYRIGP